jgi:hypothetical protein
MAISKGTFCRHCKLSGKVLSGVRRREGQFHYLLLSVLFSFTMPLITALQLVRISRFVDFPQQACSFTCIDALWERNTWHLQHTDAWIVVEMVLVMTVIIIIIIIIIIVTKFRIDLQFPRSRHTYQFQSSYDLVRHISATRILRFVRLIELQQDYHVRHNSRRTLKQRKQNRMQH